MKKLSTVLIFAFSCVFGMQTDSQRVSFEEFTSSYPPPLAGNAQIIALEVYIFLQRMNPQLPGSCHKIHNNTRTRRPKRKTRSAKMTTKNHSLAKPSPFVCKGCDRAYSSIYRLKYHMESYHPELVGLIQSDYMHIRPYQCPHCVLAFNDKNHLGSHIQTRHEGIKRITCALCGKRYLGSLCNKKKHEYTCMLD